MSVWASGVWGSGVWASGVWAEDATNCVWANGVWASGFWANGVWYCSGVTPTPTPTPTPRRGGDDRPPGWSKKRAKLKLDREREFTEQIRDIYRELTGSPQAEEAEAILGRVSPPIVAQGESLDARAAALRARADQFDPSAVEAEIALRLLYRDLVQKIEEDDARAIELLLGHVL